MASGTDPTAFAELYGRRHRTVLGFFLGRTSCPHMSAELTAETFAQVWASLHRFDPAKGTANAWIGGIAGNVHRRWLRTCVMRDRARRRVGAASPHLIVDDLEQIETMVDLRRVQDVVGDALARLSPRLRDAVLLRVACDLPYSEVAVRLGCSPGTARVRVSRGLALLSSQADRERQPRRCSGDLAPAATRSPRSSVR